MTNALAMLRLLPMSDRAKDAGILDGGCYLSNPDGTEATPGNVVYSIPVNRGSGITGWFVSGNVMTNLKVVGLAQYIF